MLPFGFLSFLVFGLVLVLVGSNQEHLARDLGLDLAGSGLLAAVLQLGLGVGVVGAGPLFDRFPRRPLFVGSMLVAGIALLGVEAGMGYERWLVHLALTGLGIGAYDTLVNAAVVQRFAERSMRPMSVLHAAATLGAMSGPILAGVLADAGHWVQSFHAAGAAHLALAFAALFVPFPDPQAREAGRRTRAAGIRPLVPFALIAFAYVGIEASATVLAVPYASHLGLEAARGRFGISAFWLGLFAGRIGVLALRRPLDARLLGACGLAGAVFVGVGTLLPLGQVEGTLFAVGLALGCVYPVMIALAGQALPGAQGLAAGLAAGAGALGGFAIPWLSGAIGDVHGAGAAVASLALSSLVIFAAASASRLFAR